MKLPQLFMFTFLLLSFANVQKKTIGIHRFYDIKSCKIKFRFLKGAQSGEKIFVFDNWGNVEKEEITTINDTTIMKKGFSSVSDSAIDFTIPAKLDQLIIRTPQFIYTINLDQNVGYKQKNNSSNILEQMDSNSSMIIGKDTILGKPCQVLEIEHSMKIWLWNKIALKKQLLQKIDGMQMEESAIEVDEHYKIDPNEFGIPKGVIIK